MKPGTRPFTIFRNLSLFLAVLPISITALAQGPSPHGLYVPPNSSFIQDPTETPIRIDLGTMPLSRVQKQLDDARAADSNSPIILTLTGTYLVTNTPLTLPSKTSLVLYGSIQAIPGAAAPSLIAVTGQSEVGIAGGLLDGHGANLMGIDVENSTKVNIDAVTVTHTGQDGIVLKGAGNTVWDSGSAITRCEVNRAGGNGITVGAIPQALVLDNFVHRSAAVGIQVSAVYSSIVNNVSRNNDIGIVADANDNLIADNEIRGNRNGGLQLKSSSSNTAILRNAVLENSTSGIDLDGSNNLVYDNLLHNPNDLTERAAGNWVVTDSAPLKAIQSQYFYPPTINNRHSLPVMNGRNRTDLAIDASTVSTISGVQQAYDAVQQQHPDDVIVLTLSGTFTADGVPLLLQSHTAVILDGTIQVPSGSTLSQVITAANPSEFISISGGMIDLGGRSMEGIFLPSTTMAYIDHVKVTNGGQRDVRAGKGMIHLQRGGGYNILHANTVDNSGGRCIWTQFANARYVVLENYLTNCNMDGVDFDSTTSNSLAIGNNNVDNLRYGVFIEQSDSFNKVYANTTTTGGIASIPGHGIGVYNNATSSSTRQVTDGNTVFSNISDVISNGLRVGSIATATGGVAETAHSFLFNNIVKNSRTDGILFDTQFPRSIQNYFSQTLLSGNGTDLNSHPSNGATPPEFFNPPAAVNLALHQPITASSSAPGSSPDAAVDGLSFTNWISGNERQSWLTIDLGSVATVQRVVLKQASIPSLFLITLQSSQDGSSFTNIPGTVRPAGITPVDNIAFSPVSARFIRIRIDRLFNGPIGFEEVSVQPR